MDNKIPTITVIIPTYNRSDRVKNAVKSVLNQTFNDFEIIVIDDHSDDDTESVVTSLNDPRIKYIRHDKQRGAPGARNTGIKTGRGEFIAFLDDDDEWLPKKLQNQIVKFNSLTDKTGLVYCGAETIQFETGKTISSTLPNLKGSIIKEILRNNFILSPTPLVRKKCFDVVGYCDETLPGCQDWDMWLRIAEQFEIDFVDKILAKYFVHGNQLSANIKKRIVARTIFLEKHKSLYKKLGLNAYVDQMNHLGLLCLIAEENNDACKFFCESIKSKPIQKNGYIHLMCSLLAPSLYRNNLALVKLKQQGEVVFY